jgi:hypothetical protein
MSAGGPSKVLPFAFSFGALGIAASFASDQLHEYKIRRALLGMEAEETHTVEGMGGASKSRIQEHRSTEEQKAEEVTSSIWDWLPVRRATEEEIRRREHTVEESLALQKQREKNKQ